MLHEFLRKAAGPNLVPGVVKHPESNGTPTITASTGSCFL